MRHLPWTGRASQPREPGTACVIGGGVSGLATAALLAADGWQVDLVERSERPGGRAGLWEQDGYRFDTGPSWYLMPEVFAHFFEMLGTSVDAELDLVRLDPGYRVFFEHDDEPVDVRATRAANETLFESLEAGAGSALSDYLDSARHVYELAVDRFLYTSFDSSGSLLNADVLRNGPRSRAC